MNIITTALLWFTYFISLYFAVFWLLVFLLKTNQPEHVDLPLELDDYPIVTIAVPAYNEEKSIGSTIETLLSLNYPKDKLEIFVVNDGSSDKTEEITKKIIKQYKDHNVTLINQKNQGKGAALNHALKKGTGKFFVCLDADSFVEKDALNKMLPYFSNENVAAVLPSLKVHKPKNLLQKLQWYEYIINMFYKELMGKLDCVHVTPGPFSVYSADILKKVGCFDEDNMTEDLEMALRLQSKHYKIIQLLDTDVLTLSPENIKDLYKQRNRWFKGATLNAFKYRGMIFNPTYGDFGLIQMPTIIFSGIIAIIIISSMAYYGLKPQLAYFYNLTFINFDFLTLLKSFEINLMLLDLDYITIFVGVVMLIVSLIIMKKSEVSLREKLTKYGSLPIVAYLLLYFLLLGFIWFGVMFDIIRGKKQRW